jgi:hypothetical protein
MPTIVIPRWVNAVEAEWKLYRRYPLAWSLLSAWGLA